jgi:hypothetical protein
MHDQDSRVTETYEEAPENLCTRSLGPGLFFLEVSIVYIPYRARFLSVSFAAFFVLFFNINSSLFIKQEELPGSITTLTGSQTDGTDSTTTYTLNPYLLSRQFGRLVSEIQYLPMIGSIPVSHPVYFEKASPELISFVAHVYNGEARTVRGVYVPGIMALPVIQQPSGDIAFVSNDDNTITQFQSAAVNGVTGLLAHNYLSGASFYNLQMDQEIFIVYGDGTVRRYIVDKISQYQRLERSNLRSNFVDLSDNSALSSDQVFSRYYRGTHRVTFQTCLAGRGFSNWGLQFAQARALDAAPLIPVP